MNTRAGARPILVGVDGSAAGTAGLGWAVAEARRRSLPLQVVYVLEQSHSDAFTRANPVYVASGLAASSADSPTRCPCPSST